MNRFPVDVWLVPLTEPAPNHLTEDETARASRFKFEEDRVRWTRARSALRVILSRYAGEDPGRLFFLYGKHGKPALPPVTTVEFNLSHAGEWAAIAVTSGQPVGIDIEKMRAGIEMARLLRRLGERNLPESIPALYQRWTDREARSKVAGGALFDQPARDVIAAKLEAPEGYTASVALTGFEPEIRYCAGGRR